MKMILFESAAVAHELKASGIAVMLQHFGNRCRFAVADTPEVRELMNNMKGRFDWSDTVVTNHLCF